MTRRRGSLVLCAAMFAVTMAAGCGLSDMCPDGLPKWSCKDLKTIYPDDGKENLYARGMTEKAITQEITHERATNNALAAMAKRLQTHVAKKMEDWTSVSEDVADAGSQAGKRYTQIVSSHFTAAHLYGCSEVEWAQGATTGAMHVLVRMPMKGNRALRDQIREKAEKTLRESQDEVVTGDLDTAIKSLDAYLAAEFAQSRP